MIKSVRPILLFPMVAAACLAAAQEGTPVAEKHYGFWDRIQLITSTWWLTTCIATSLLGLLVGFFVYKNAVSSGRATSATGSGCLVAVIVFLIAQVFAVSTLVTTVFSVPQPKETPGTATTQTATPTSTTTTGGDSAKPAPPVGASTATPKPATTTSGDDF
jgi:uncharacterized membrane protein